MSRGSIRFKMLLSGGGGGRSNVDGSAGLGYAEFVQGDGGQEAGVSPARSRHCNRGANPNISHRF